MTRATAKRTPQTVSLYPEHKQALAWLAAQYGRTISEAIRTLIDHEMTLHLGARWRQIVVIEPEQ